MKKKIQKKRDQSVFVYIQTKACYMGQKLSGLMETIRKRIQSDAN